MIATIVDTQALLDSVLAALAAGVGTTVVFSFAILGAVRFSDANREGRGVEAALFGVLAVIGVVATIGAAVAAVIVMTTK
jgi:hypothetical protein